MPFVDTLQADRGLEAFGSDGLEAARKASHVGRGEARRQLIAVAILSDMAREGRTLAVVVRPYAYTHPVSGTEVSIDIPPGFVTDFASIPPFFHFLIQPFGRHAPAAVVHDYLYAIGARKARRLADRLFLHAMQEAGVGLVARSLMYRAVRTFGWGGYGRPDDWAFVDPETGDETGEPFARDTVNWVPAKADRRKARGA